jgi:hypothetical protein
LIWQHDDSHQPWSSVCKEEQQRRLVYTRQSTIFGDNDDEMGLILQ